MSKITVLDKHTAELIAAGEVVERPASIVKELIENAVDAGAGQITVEIKNGGISYIRVTDNGDGIAREDIRNAFVRHATSKISKPSDLDAISTMGFRGEALASISAVSRVEVLTRTKSDIEGTLYIIEGGEEIDCCDAGSPVGTTFTIRDVFYNTPARLKFLKKDVTEGNGVMGVVEKAALADTSVAFRFIRDGQTKLQTPGDGKLISAALAVFGREYAQNVLDVAYKVNGLEVSGIVGKPQVARGSRSYQNFFVNNRFIQSKTCMAALEQAFKGEIMVGKFPGCVLNITMPYWAVDVNVHPAKTQVRFADEKAVFDLVYYAVKSVLKSSVLAPEISSDSSRKKQEDFLNLSQEKVTAGTQLRMTAQEYKNLVLGDSKPDTVRANMPVSFEAPPVISAVALMPPIIVSADGQKDADCGAGQRDELSDGNQDEAAQPVPALERRFPGVPVDDDIQDDGAISREIYGNIRMRAASIDVETDDEEIERENPFENARIIGEVFETYIVLQKDDSLVFVDKHAAHERLLYNRLRARGVGEQRQVLLQPITIRVSPDEYSAILENIPLFDRLGISLESFGDRDIIIREAAPMMTDLDLGAVVSQFAQKLIVGAGKDWLPDKLEDMFHTMACRAAVKANDKTPAIALEELLKMLSEDKNAQHCPHGRPISVLLTRHELEKRFGRLG